MLVFQSCLILCNSTNCSPPGSSVHGICQAVILEWVAIPFSRRSFWPRDQTQVYHIAARFFTVWATSEALVKDYYWLFPYLTMKPGSISDRFIGRCMILTWSGGRSIFTLACLPFLTRQKQCRRLWCTSAEGVHKGCRTQHMPLADGTNCGPGMVGFLEGWVLYQEIIQGCDCSVFQHASLFTIIFSSASWVNVFAVFVSYMFSSELEFTFYPVFKIKQMIIIVT